MDHRAHHDAFLRHDRSLPLPRKIISRVHFNLNNSPHWLRRVSPSMFEGVFIHCSQPCSHMAIRANASLLRAGITPSRGVVYNRFAVSRIGITGLRAENANCVHRSHHSVLREQGLPAESSCTTFNLLSISEKRPALEWHGAGPRSGPQPGSARPSCSARCPGPGR